MAIEGKRRYFVTVVMMMMMMMMIVALFGQDVLLVGDSAGMVVHGHDTTLPISLDMMISHCQVTIGVVASINIVRVSLLCILFPPQSFPLFLFFFPPLQTIPALVCAIACRKKTQQNKD